MGKNMKNTALQFLKFGMVGVANTIISYLIYAVVFAVSGNYVLGNVIAWLLSVLHAYMWQTVFVFRQDAKREKRVWWKFLLKTYMSYAFT